jgi:1-acyl-sn-glycerol-3-phosphate acyltransferase
MKVGCPIYPVGIVGTDSIQPPHAKLPKLFKRATITVGRPVKVERYADRKDDRLVLRQIIDEVMYEIREMTGQQYVNRYATKKAEDLPTARAHVSTAAELAEREPELATA